MGSVTFAIFASIKSKRVGRHARGAITVNSNFCKSTYYQCNRSDERYLIIDAIEWCLTTVSKVTYRSLNGHVTRIYSHDCCGYVDVDKCVDLVWYIRSLGSEALKSKQEELKSTQRTVA